MQIAKMLVVLTLLFGFAAAEAEAAQKKVSSSTISAAQRKKMYDYGLISCRKQFGTRLHFVKVEKFYGRLGGSLLPLLTAQAI